MYSSYLAVVVQEASVAHWESQAEQVQWVHLRVQSDSSDIVFFETYNHTFQITNV